MNLGKATKVIDKEWSCKWVPLTRFNYHILGSKHFVLVTPIIVVHKIEKIGGMDILNFWHLFSRRNMNEKR